MTPLQIAKQLRRLSTAMVTLGVAMDYHGGFGEVAEHGRELVGAGETCRNWARTIEREHAARRAVQEPAA